MTKSILSLSFCITCKNRLHQMRQTLKQNLDDNRLFTPLIEFVLVDFGSTDGLREWVNSEFSADLQSGYLRYIYTDRLSTWHLSIAKNTAHYYAKNDILVNLDCDNYTGRFGGRYVIRQFMKYTEPIVFHQFAGNYSDGTCGRVAVKRKDFIEIGGYDESFEPMGFQDVDLMYRLQSNGLRYIIAQNGDYAHAEKNTKIESIAHTGSSLSWEEMDRINRQKSIANLQSGHFVANNGIFGIRDKID